MAELTVIEGNFGVSKNDIEDNAVVIAELEKWLARAKDRKIVAIAIAAVSADDSMLTQYAPSSPRNVFTLFGGIQSIALRLWNDRIQH